MGNKSLCETCKWFYKPKITAYQWGECRDPLKAIYFQSGMRDNQPPNVKEYTLCKNHQTAGGIFNDQGDLGEEPPPTFLEKINVLRSWVNSEIKKTSAYKVAIKIGIKRKTLVIFANNQADVKATTLIKIEMARGENG